MLRSKKKTYTRLLVLSALIATASVAVAGPALAACDVGRFCAFNLTDYGDKVLDSGAGAGSSFVDVADDVVSSAKNRTGNNWCGVESDGWPDQTIFAFANNTWYSTLGSDNNMIDHFYVRSGACD